MVTELDLMSVFQLQRVNSSLPFFFLARDEWIWYILSRFNFNWG